MDGQTTLGLLCIQIYDTDIGNTLSMNLIDVEYFTETETCLDKRMMMAQNMTHCTKCPDTIPGCSG